MYNDEHNLYHDTYRKDGSEAEAHSAPQPGPVQDHNSGPQQPVQEMKPVKKNRIGLKVTALALCCALLGGAVGGGVVGDLAGFAAATYQRGMGFAQIPTTLLAAVDSSVGGKTAVDLPTGKNQAGSFYQPCIVLCDPDTLESLPEEQYRCGCAEIIKTAMLFDAGFFRGLRQTPVRGQL